MYVAYVCVDRQQGVFLVFLVVFVIFHKRHVCVCNIEFNIGLPYRCADGLMDIFMHTFQMNAFSVHVRRGDGI